MTTPHPDAKTLIRHAMQALDDELGLSEADPYRRRLQELLWDLRAREDRARGLTPIRATGLNVAIDRPRTASVNHARDRAAAIHVVDGGNDAA